jgi:hypothetical protein
LVPAGASWKYLDTGTNAGVVWRETDFDDSAWPSGPAVLGYGDAKDGRPEATLVSFGTNASAKHITTYFRHAFEVAQPGGYTSLALALKRDDGGVVYLNGKEIFRSNLPEGTVDYLTRAADTATDDGDQFYRTNVPASLLLPGRNVLAVEIHQDGPGSSDISFDLELVGAGVPELKPTRFGADWVLIWPDAEAVLETAGDLSGPWMRAAIGSPALIEPAGSRRFYRIARPLAYSPGVGDSPASE